MVGLSGFLQIVPNLKFSMFGFPFWNSNGYRVFQNPPAAYQAVICIMGVYLLTLCIRPRNPPQHYFQEDSEKYRRYKAHSRMFSSLYKIPLWPWVLLHRDLIFNIGATFHKNIRSHNYSSLINQLKSTVWNPWFLVSTVLSSLENI